jgi:hypothetical protein
MKPDAIGNETKKGAITIDTKYTTATMTSARV